MNMFKIYGRRQMLTTLFAVLVFAVVFATALSGAASTVSTSPRKLPIYAVGRNENDKVISISFDAACPAG